MPELTDSQRSAEAVRKAWGQTLYVERHRQHRKQAEVAKAAGVDQTTLSGAERGQGSLDTFIAIASALGVTLVEVGE